MTGELELERVKVKFFNNTKGYGVAVRPDGTTVFLPGPCAGLYENGSIRRPYMGEKIQVPFADDTVVCQTKPNERPPANEPNARVAILWAIERK